MQQRAWAGIEPRPLKEGVALYGLRLRPKSHQDTPLIRICEEMSLSGLSYHHLVYSMMDPLICGRQPPPRRFPPVPLFTRHVFCFLHSPHVFSPKKLVCFMAGDQIPSTNGLDGEPGMTQGYFHIRINKE